MKKLLFILPVMIFVGGFIFLKLRPDTLGMANNSGTAGIASPLPDLLSGVLGSASANEDYWKPHIEDIVPSSVKKPNLTAVSALSYDLTNDRLLYGREINRRLPIASLTKIMTAVVALENSELTDEYTVSRHAAEVGENTMGLTNGEVLTLEELLYGLILHSGNDAAETIAEGSPYGRENFVYLMNKKAEDLGLADTRFTNPSGLEGDGNQYGTVHDLLVITRYALKNPVFAKIAATVEHELLFSPKHKYIYLFNETNLLTSYPGVKGVKTGYTGEAGLCLVTYLEYDGRKVISVLLNAQNRRQEMKDLLDYSLKTLGVKPPPHS